jgi:hypothetical protein
MLLDKGNIASGVVIYPFTERSAAPNFISGFKQ